MGSRTHCQEICRQIPSCVSWNYYDVTYNVDRTLQEKCEILDEHVTGILTENGVTSGFRFCKGSYLLGIGLGNFWFTINN